MLYSCEFVFFSLNGVTETDTDPTCVTLSEFLMITFVVVFHPFYNVTTLKKGKQMMPAQGDSTRAG